MVSNPPLYIIAEDKRKRNMIAPFKESPLLGGRQTMNIKECNFINVQGNTRRGKRGKKISVGLMAGGATGLACPGV